MILEGSIDEHRIQENDLLGREEFLNLSNNYSRPLILRTGIRLLGALRTADYDGLEPYGQSLVPVVSVAGLNRKDEDWRRRRTGERFEEVPLRELLARMRAWSSDSERSYITRGLPMKTMFPALWDKIQYESFFASSENISGSLRIGTGRTLSGLHTDNCRNISAQVLGEKEWTIYAPSQTPFIAGSWLGEYLDTSSAIHRSRVDLEHLDPIKFPRFVRAKVYARFVLQPGDVLYLPLRWWHRVKSVSPSISFRLEVPGSMVRDRCIGTSLQARAAEIYFEASSGNLRKAARSFFRCGG
jgi:hypothetical protein